MTPALLINRSTGRPLASMISGKCAHRSEAGQIEHGEAYLRRRQSAHDVLNREAALLCISAGHQKIASCTRQGECGFVAKSSGCPGDDSELAVLGWYICD